MRLADALARWILALVILPLMASPSLADEKAPSRAKAMSLTFRGVDYEHRWSKGNQNELTPRGQANGAQVERALMAWDKLPTPAALRALPQSK